MMKTVKAWMLLVLTLCAFAILAAPPDAGPPGSVRNVMMTEITSTTNTIWGIEDPRTEEAWQVYIDAAAALIDAARQVRAGGLGPNDAAWAKDPEWQRQADLLIESAIDIQAAARERNLDTLINVSNDKMYPPCEECHNRFLPGAQ